ncbi:MAG: translation initiation factor IF-2 [Bacteroidetes bacterium]|nr:translation initiation factor IF-2 [Bacteroidota bacterium]
MSEVKTLRLSKVAKDLNVGVATLVETLNKHGYSIESNPNSKISEDHYLILCKEHQSDVQAKEKSRQMGGSPVQRETVTIEDVKKTETPHVYDEPQQEMLIKDISLSAPAKAGPEPVKETPKVEPPVSEGPSIPTEDKPQAGGIKVLGKIDLAPKKPVKKAEPAKEQPKPEPVKKEEPKTEKAEKPAEPTPSAQPQAPTADTPTDEPKSVDPVLPQPDAAPEVYRAAASKLDGPTIIGKIELPAAGDRRSDDKTKRKRITKEGIKSPTLQGGQNQGQGQGQSGQGQSGPGQRGPGQFQRGPGQPGQQGQRGPAGGQRGPRKDIRPEIKVELTEEQIQKQIKETLARLSERGKSNSVKMRRQKREGIREKIQNQAEATERESKILKVTEFVSANELSQMMDISVTEIISACMSLGLFVSINQRLDAETIQIIAEEFGHEIKFVSADTEDAEEEEVDSPESLSDRPPIVTVMGHVDHGKTSLLDYIRKANVIAGEAGGITQHIGAYGVTLDGGKQITFIDTPGHEAFTAMRARGAQLTDVAIIVIAADDSVMPQTVEAINHAKAANVPMVFAINKIDKPGANSEKIREALANMNLLVEDWGGKYQCQEISAKQGLNIDALLDKVLLEAEMLELKSNPDKNAQGVVIEAQLDKGRGYVATLLVQSGSLSMGDVVLAGQFSGRVKAMFNERGTPIKKAGPAMPVRVLGLNGAPQAGDKFKVMDDEREAREIATKRQQLQREQGLRTRKHITLDEIGRRIAIGDFQQLNIIIKADTDGSAEALTDSLLKLSTDSIQVNIIHKSVGAISESDVMLASASDAIIVGFQVRPSPAVRRLAEAEEIDIRTYSIIYQAIDEVKAAMEGMLAPEFEEKVTATVEVRDVFSITKVGTVAGCYVTDGKIARNHKVRIIREGIVMHTGKLSSLKRFKDDVKEVATSYECGLTIDRFNDIQIGDIIEAFEEVEVKRKL